MFGAAFGEVTKGGINQDFQKIFIDDAEKVKGGGNYNNADTIQVWDPLLGSTGGYTIYYMYYDGSGTYDYIWYFYNDDEIESPMETKQGFWYNSQQKQVVEMTVAGEVNLAATTTKHIHPGRNLIAFPYPTDFEVNEDVNWKTSGAIGGGNYNSADTIQIWDPTLGSTGGYVIYYMYFDGSGEYDYVWYFYNDDEIESPIPAAKGFWYNHKGAGFDLKFMRPFNVDDVE